MHVNEITGELIQIYIDDNGNFFVKRSIKINDYITSQSKGTLQFEETMKKTMIELGLNADLSEGQSQSADYDGNVYLKIGSTIAVINKDSGKTWNPLEGKMNRKDGLKSKLSEIPDFQRIVQFIVQENVIITQSDDNIIRMYTKQFGLYSYTIERIKEISLGVSEEEIGMKIFKFHAGQLYLKND